MTEVATDLITSQCLKLIKGDFNKRFTTPEEERWGWKERSAAVSSISPTLSIQEFNWTKKTRSEALDATKLHVSE